MYQISMYSDLHLISPFQKSNVDISNLSFLEIVTFMSLKASKTQDFASEDLPKL